MDDLISRQAAIDAIVNTVSDVGLHDNSETARYGATYRQQEILTILESLPSADRPKGKWILTEDDNYEYCTCSECGYQNGENWMNGSDIPFCAVCGADMRGENYDKG